MSAPVANRTSLRRLLVAAVILAAAAGAGCGGNSEEAGVTKAQFTKQANAICGKRREERAQAFKKAAPDEQEVEQVIVDKSLPPYRQMAKEVEELPAPSDDEEQIEKIFLLMEKAAASVEDDLTGATPAISEANAAVRAYGLSDCTF